MTKAEIISSVNIVEVIRNFVQLKPVKDFYESVSCPFCTDTSNKFTVFPDVRVYKCYHCGIDGDVVSFLQNHEKISEEEAIKWLEEECVKNAPPKIIEVPYDSTYDTNMHIKRVAQLLTNAAGELIRRANVHDDSKLVSPEKEYFDIYTPKLKGSTYGSDEYKQFLTELKVGLDHHYANNSHHPEHYENGINGFDLFDLIEMFFDWRAASERHGDGDIYKSISINKGRFNMSDQIADIFTNTAKRLGYEK